MRKSICALFLIAALSVSIQAGDVGTPGRTDPPPCTVNCATTQTSDPTTYDEIRVFVIEVILALIKK